jgi:citrate lyase subunit gamma (acyl carrier protein)
MKLMHRASAGSFESSDMLVLVEPAGAGTGRVIELDSVVLSQYGESIRAEVNRILDQHQVRDAKLVIRDKGALVPTIGARVETAIRRALGTQERRADGAQ